MINSELLERNPDPAELSPETVGRLGFIMVAVQPETTTAWAFDNTNLALDVIPTSSDMHWGSEDEITDRAIVTARHYEVPFVKVNIPLLIEATQAIKSIRKQLESIKAESGDPTQPTI